jgi:hypothetical protein
VRSPQTPVYVVYGVLRGQRRCPAIPRWCGTNGGVDTLRVFVDSGEASQQAPVTDALYRGQGEPIEVSGSRRLGPRVTS